jgi:hypothetical protein
MTRFRHIELHGHAVAAHDAAGNRSVAVTYWGALPTCSIAEAIGALLRPRNPPPRRNVPSYAVRM